MSNVPPFELPDVEVEGHRSKYDIDTRILVTAIFCLLFVVALVTFLHLYTRYVLRRQRVAHRTTSISLFRVGVPFAGPRVDEPPKAGLEPSAITALPTFLYRRLISINNASNDKKKSDGSGSAAPDECAICLSAIEEGEMVRVLPSCRHVFHVGCIDMWLGSNSTCPVCRAGVEPPPPPPPAVAVAVEMGESSAPTRELPGGGVTEGTWETKEGGGSMSSRFSSSFRRMYALSRERPAGRRTHGVEIEDLERQY